MRVIVVQAKGSRGAKTMNRSYVLAIGALALTVTTSGQLIAAESEMAAPQERAAPARERAAPSARRTQPARQGAQRQQASQSTQQTWSGSQVGGFGGGNMGGAGFADSACVGHMGFLFQSNLPTPNCLALDSKAPNTTSASGGFSAGWGTLVPGTRVYAGVEAMWSANRVRNTYTLNQAYPGQFAACCQELTNDTRTATTSIGSSFSALARIGYLVTDKTLVYFSGGSATANVSSTFTHTAVATINFPTTTTVVSGTSSVSKTVTGYALGGGVEFAYLPGVKIRLQYLRAQFPDVTFVTPLPVTICTAPLPGTCAGGAETNKVTPSFNQLTVGVNFGI